MTAPAPADRALVIGEALIDIVDRVDGSDAHVGGSPLNVAVGLSRLGVDVVFATEFADDDFGRLISAHLADAKVESVQTTTRHQPTSTARARIGSDGSAAYLFDLTWSFDPPRTRTASPWCTSARSEHCDSPERRGSSSSSRPSPGTCS